jgi:transcriptional regulator with PAS, ATPase and Fis domain
MGKLEDLDAQSVLNSIYNGITAIDESGIIKYFNETAERIFKIPAHEALDRFISEVIPHTAGKLLDCLKTGVPFYGEKLKEGEVTLIANINPIMHGGKVSGVVSVGGGSAHYAGKAVRILAINEGAENLKDFDQDETAVRGRP